MLRRINELTKSDLLEDPHTATPAVANFLKDLKHSILKEAAVEVADNVKRFIKAHG